jgi:creatinine amidohydrolase
VIRLADLTHPEARALARDPRTVVLLPLGAVEQHGPHLPLSVDWLGAEEIARRIAPPLRRGGYRPVLAPALPYGVSTLAVDWCGTVSLSRATLRRVIVEIVRALASHGFRRVVLTNYQADPDHLRAMAGAVRELGRSRRVQVLVAGFSPGPSANDPMLSPRVRALMRSPAPDFEWHSGELETAFMLSLAPRLVRRGIAKRLRPARVDFRAALRQGVTRFSEMNPHGHGYFGSPALAHPDTGRRAMTLRARLIATDLLRSLDTWPLKPRPRRAR